MVMTPVSSPSSYRCRTQDFVPLENKIERAAAELLLNRDTDRRARKKDHRPGKFFEGPVTVRDSQPCDIMNGLVLQIPPHAGIENRISERHIFGSIEPLEDLIGEIARDVVAQTRRRC